MALNRRDLILGLAACGAGLAFPARAKARILAGPAFGTSWRIVLGQVADATPVEAAVAAIVAEVDAAMSPYKASSDISRFNTSKTTDWQQMPANLCAVAFEALNVAALTGGAFDPTVGPIVGRLGFGPIKGEVGSHEGISIADAAIQKDQPRLTLDLCGIAKGYGLDRIVSALESLGVRNALIELGGEVMARGHHGDGRAWQVAIEDPGVEDFAVQRIVVPGRLALATSGHSANGVQARASTSHIIDPRLGRPAAMALASVSVLAPTAMRADALATALCAAGPEDGIALAERLGISALFITDGSQAPREVMTGDFANHVMA